LPEAKFRLVLPHQISQSAVSDLEARTERDQIQKSIGLAWEVFNIVSYLATLQRSTVNAIAQ
jgi:hypothetical protein